MRTVRISRAETGFAAPVEGNRLGRAGLRVHGDPDVIESGSQLRLFRGTHIDLDQIRAMRQCKLAIRGN
jgi:hypothetical protein